MALLPWVNLGLNVLLALAVVYLALDLRGERKAGRKLAELVDALRKQVNGHSNQLVTVQRALGALAPPDARPTRAMANPNLSPKPPQAIPNAGPVPAAPEPDPRRRDVRLDPDAVARALSEARAEAEREAVRAQIEQDKQVIRAAAERDAEARSAARVDAAATTRDPREEAIAESPSLGLTAALGGGAQAAATEQARHGLATMLGALSGRQPEAAPARHPSRPPSAPYLPTPEEKAEAQAAHAEVTGRPPRATDDNDPEEEELTQVAKRTAPADDPRQPALPFMALPPPPALSPRLPAAWEQRRAALEHELKSVPPERPTSSAARTANESAARAYAKHTALPTLMSPRDSERDSGIAPISVDGRHKQLVGAARHNGLAVDHCGCATTGCSMDTDDLWVGPPGWEKIGLGTCLCPCDACNRNNQYRAQAERELIRDDGPPPKSGPLRPSPRPPLPPRPRRQ